MEMPPEEFERLVAEEFPRAVPDRYHSYIKNVAMLIEEQPSPALKRERHLSANETLLGLYRGIPFDERGGQYGIGETMPDTITLFRLPILSVAGENEEEIRRIIRETIWHEVAHYFGFSEAQVRDREGRGTNYSQ